MGNASLLRLDVILLEIAETEVMSKTAVIIHIPICIQSNAYTLFNSLKLSVTLNYVISSVFVSIGCSSSQFTCANGQCVPLTARCNSINECADNSDEQNCGNE